MRSTGCGVTRRLIASELRLLGRNEREYKLMLKICEMLAGPVDAAV